MRIRGAAIKTLVLIVFTLCAFVGTWSVLSQASETLDLDGYAFLALLLGLFISFVIAFNKPLAVYLAIPYATLEGISIGWLSFLVEKVYPHIILHAVALTFGALIVLLFIYLARLIPPSANLMLGVTAATGGIALVYLVDILLWFFGSSVPLVHEASPLGIVLSLVIVLVAALNFVLDFDFIENGARRGAPRYMEWYGAFGLLVTLVWLYLELLRLLAKFRRK